jgi:hypothetical protein
MEISLQRKGNPVTYSATLRYVPETIGILGPRGFYPHAPVTQVIAHPPGQHPKGVPIFTEMYAVEIKTPFGSRWYGATRAFIDSTLRMVMDCNDHDEVLRKWDLYLG